MSDYPFVLQGNSYDLSDFSGTAYITGLPASMTDLVREFLLLHSGTSTTSLSLSVGSKAVTTNSGKAFRVGDVVSIVSTADPSNFRMWGPVTAYDYSTGSMTVNVVGVHGSGTLASWNLCIGGCHSDFGALSIVSLDNGGLGTGSDGFIAPAGMLGIGTPSTHMCEIYEDWVGNVGGHSSGDNTVRVAQPPWFSSGERATNKWTDINNDTDTGAGTYLLTGDLASSAVYGGVARLIYGNSGFVHAGRGATVWETNLYRAGSADYGFRCGLKTNGIRSGTNIFGHGGIGFEARQDLNSGMIVLVCGRDGTVSNYYTSVTPNPTGPDKLRFEVDHDGRAVDFFINGNYVYTFEGKCPTDGAANLLQPAYEVICENPDGTSATPTLYIESMFFRKFVLR